MTDSGITCIKCGYDMRLLDKSQCPECGWKFRLDEYERFKKHVRFTPLYWVISILTCCYTTIKVIYDTTNTIYENNHYTNICSMYDHLAEPWPEFLSPIFHTTWFWVAICLINTAICHIHIRLWSIICRDAVYISFIVWNVFYLYDTYAPMPAP